MATFLSSRRYEALASILLLISLVRIVFSYSHTAQAFDEPSHIAAGIEFLDKRTYLLDPTHPPLAPIAIGFPLFVAGERYPALAPDDPGSHNYNVVGNKVIYDSGRFRRNLALARIGVIPFFLLGAFVVWLWALRVGGKRAGLVAVFLYTTTPTVLAFSSVAYTDIGAASMQLAAMFSFLLWLATPNRRNAVWLGAFLGLAVATKFTSFIFLPAAFLCIAIAWFLRQTAKTEQREDPSWPRRVAMLAASLGLSAVVLWACYGFSVKPVDEAVGISPLNMPSFQHFPGALRSRLQKLIATDPRVPAPELWNGLASAWVLNRAESPSFLLGRRKLGGWWYFFPVALLVKLPLPLLIALALGAVLIVMRRRNEELYPLAGLAGILLVTTQVNYQVGTRHVLVCVLLMCITASTGLISLLDSTSLRSVAVLTVVAVVLWQGIESARSQSDFLAYFNELAGRDPSRVLATGCDLECGQDMYALARELRARGIAHFTLATWTSADVDRLDLPGYDVPHLNERPTGWIAIGYRTMRTGDFLHEELPPESFDWIQRYKPVAEIGKTIELYYVEPNSASLPSAQ